MKALMSNIFFIKHEYYNRLLLVCRLSFTSSMQPSVNYTVSYSERVTKEQVIEEAKSIWDNLLKLRIKNDDEKLHSFFEAQYDLHRDLFRAYPVVMKYMCLLHKFNSDAFGRHIDAYAVHSSKLSNENKKTDNLDKKAQEDKRRCDEDEFYGLQADYVVDLTRIIKKTQRGGYYKLLRESVIESLRSEAKEFKEQIEAEKAKTEERVKQYLMMDRQGLKDYIVSLNKSTQDTPEKRDELFIAKQVDKLRDDESFNKLESIEIKPFEAEVTANDLLC